ncbi:MAG TPA: ribokinase [Candidatus Choladocola avistercoris]|nr:ribokinase [Candidatus Choladocola avistercoris]
MRVLCFGSLNIDYTYKVDHFVGKGETLSSESLQVFSGGKGLNQSIALAKAGADTYHAGAIGEDGRFLLKIMEDAGVHTEYVAELPDVRTGNAIIQNDREGDNCILLYGGANQAVTQEQVDEVLSHFQAGDFLVLQNEINELEYIVRKAHEKKMKIVLNPSPMNEKVTALPLDFVDYFMLNEVEAGQILGRAVQDGYDGEALASALLARFPDAAVVLTLGGDGSVYMDREKTIRQPVYKVKAVDTTAAGDTFTGFFIGGIMNGLTVNEAMDQASRAAAIAVTRQGAAPSIPLLEEVKQF